jgi:hypothetical protein
VPSNTQLELIRLLPIWLKAVCLVSEVKNPPPGDGKFHISESAAAIRDTNRARIFKLLISPRIDSREPIPPGYKAGRYDNPIPTWFLALIYRVLFKNSSTGFRICVPFGLQMLDFEFDPFYGSVKQLASIKKSNMISEAADSPLECMFNAVIFCLQVVQV